MKTTKQLKDKKALQSCCSASLSNTKFIPEEQISACGEKGGLRQSYLMPSRPPQTQACEGALGLQDGWQACGQPGSGHEAQVQLLKGVRALLAMPSWCWPDDNTERLWKRETWVPLVC